jgi:glucosamine-6-phosphate deaminase
MNLIRVKNYNAMTNCLLDIFVKQIKAKPDSVLSFTTGATPKGLLESLAKEVNKGLDIGRCTFCNLDEYVGKRSGIYSVCSFMNRYFYDVVKQQPKNIFMLNAEAEDKTAEIKKYAQILAQHPRDIQLLGLGTNGHIGANEPGTSFDSTLFVADSHESTIKATQNLFNLKYEETPRQMFTMGFKEIMAAKCVILAASGKSKAEAAKKVVEGNVSKEVPASYLKTHKNFTFIIDEDAASLLSK